MRHYVRPLICRNEYITFYCGKNNKMIKKKKKKLQDILIRFWIIVENNLGGKHKFVMFCSAR